MNNKSEIEQKVAEFLLQIKAIKLQPNNPFTWASGWKSPIYCDNRITLSHPGIRTYIRQKLSALIQEEFGSASVVAGVATATVVSSFFITFIILFNYLYPKYNILFLRSQTYFNR